MPHVRVASSRTIFLLYRAGGTLLFYQQNAVPYRINGLGEVQSIIIMDCGPCTSKLVIGSLFDVFL